VPPRAPKGICAYPNLRQPPKNKTSD